MIFIVFLVETIVALCVTSFSGAGVSPDAGFEMSEKGVFKWSTVHKPKSMFLYTDQRFVRKRTFVLIIRIICTIFEV